jgi:hypothetical protein
MRRLHARRCASFRSSRLISRICSHWIAQGTALSTRAPRSSITCEGSWLSMALCCRRVRGVSGPKRLRALGSEIIHGSHGRGCKVLLQPTPEAMCSIGGWPTT